MKRPDHSIEIEQALLGSCLMYGERAMAEAGDIAQPEYFFEPLHQQIFDVARTLHQMGKVANAVTIGAFLPEDAMIGQMTIRQYIARLSAEAVPLVGLADYARTVRDFYDRRQITVIGNQIADGYSPEHDNPDAVQLASYAIDNLDAIVAARSEVTARAMTLGHSMARAIDAAAKAYENDGAITGLSWGLREMDHKTLGLNAGELIVVAGRPSMGKSALIASWARKVTAGPTGAPGILFSLEMGDIDISTRILSDEMHAIGINVPFWAIKSGRFKEAYFNTMIDATRRLQDQPLIIEQQPNLSLAQISSRIRQAKRRQGIKWAAVDHLGLVKPSERYKGNKASELGEVTSGLKGLAKELGIPILLLAQINRQVESRDDKRPQLSDLRDSGRIEEDADVIVMLYRKAYYLLRSQPPAGVAEHIKWQQDLEQWHDKLDLGIEKNRNGPTGSVRVFVDIGSNAIRDLPDTTTPTTAEVQEVFAA
jgi:replicative DNA helicase